MQPGKLNVCWADMKHYKEIKKQTILWTAMQGYLYKPLITDTPKIIKKNRLDL